jgi:hypothetical protein
MPFEHAALTEPLACVMRGLEESHARPGQTAIVLGAGPIGLLFIHAASLQGLQRDRGGEAQGPGGDGEALWRGTGGPALRMWTTRSPPPAR